MSSIKEKNEEKLYTQNGNILYILNVLKKYSDANHMLSISEIKDKIKEIYDQDIDQRTLRRNIKLLQVKFGYDISTYNDNRKGYYISSDPETDFEPGEIRAIIDTFNYAGYIESGISKQIIKKCKNLQNIYENEKIKNYKVYSSKGRTRNLEVIKNIEDISNSIMNKNMVEFEYWKYCISGDQIERKIVNKPVVSPYAIVYDKQQFYMIGIKDGNSNFFHYRLDRIKNLKELDKKIRIKKTDKEIENYAENSVEVFGGNNTEIEAECKECILEEVIESFGKNVEIIPLNKDCFKIKLSVDDTGFKFWALRNIDCVTVTKPASLVRQIRNELVDAEKRYSKGKVNE